MGTRRVNELDLLRFIAAISVTLFHLAFRGFAADDLSRLPYPLLAPVAKYGFLGVELFFMISGFVILMTASRGDLNHFVISRLTRLYPIFWVCCTLTFIVTLVLGGEHFSASLGQYLVNLTMLSGFTDVAPLDGAYWSLFVELKFYFLVALVVLFRQLERTQLLLAAWLGVSIFLNIFPNKVLGLVLTADFAPLFVGGAVCYLIYAKGVSAARLALLGVAWAAAVQHALGAVPAFEQKYRTDLSEYAITGTLSVMFVIFLLIALNRTGGLAKTNWVALGALTYPLYLIHQNIGYMIFNLMYPALNPHVLMWGTVALMLVCAHLLHRFVEQRYSGHFKWFLEAASKRLNPFVRTPPQTPARPVPTHRHMLSSSAWPSRQPTRSTLKRAPRGARGWKRITRNLRGYGSSSTKRGAARR